MLIIERWDSSDIVNKVYQSGKVLKHYNLCSNRRPEAGRKQI